MTDARSGRRPLRCGASGRPALPHETLFLSRRTHTTAQPWFQKCVTPPPPRFDCAPTPHLRGAFCFVVFPTFRLGTLQTCSTRLLCLSPYPCCDCMEFDWVWVSGCCVSLLLRYPPLANVLSRKRSSCALCECGYVCIQVEVFRVCARLSSHRFFNYFVSLLHSCIHTRTCEPRHRLSPLALPPSMPQAPIVVCSSSFRAVPLRPPQTEIAVAALRGGDTQHANLH